MYVRFSSHCDGRVRFEFADPCICIDADRDKNVVNIEIKTRNVLIVDWGSDIFDKKNVEKCKGLRKSHFEKEMYPLYRDASEVLELFERRKGTLKRLCIAPSIRNKKATLAITSGVVRFALFLARVEQFNLCSYEILHEFGFHFRIAGTQKFSSDV